MADRNPLITDAIATLDKKNSAARRTFYDRARASMADSLRKADPPLSLAFIEHERLALENAIGKVEAGAVLGDRTLVATAEAPSAHPDANEQRERRFAFCGFLLLAALWIGDLFYEPLTFSDRHNWLRLGGVVLFPTMTILSYFIMQKKLSVEEEDRAYIISAPIILVGTALVTIALYLILGRLAATPS